MKIKLHEIKSKIILLLENEISREEITNWAIELRSLYDQSKLKFEPIAQEDTIWKALKFLSAADLKVSPTEYFHPMKDFAEYLKKITEI